MAKDTSLSTCGEVEFTGLAQGGTAVGRLNGQVVFVPFACPGDLARVRITNDRGRFAEGQLLEVLRPSATRAQPFCPQFGRCGGCQWQHVAYPLQLEAKRQALSQNLSRVGGFSALPEIVVHPSPTPTAWRQKARLHRNAKGEFGFLAARGHELVPCAACPLLLPEVQSLADKLSAWLSRAELAPEEFSVGYSPIDGKGAASFRTPLGTNLTQSRCKGALNDVPGLDGLVVLHDDERWAFGRTDLRLAVPGETSDTRHPIDAFWQAHHELNLEARRRLAELLARTPQDGAVLELFCGAGNLSGVLADAGRPLIVNEVQGVALEAAKGNLGQRPATRFLEGPAEGALARLAEEGARIATLVLDPPRAGFKDGLEGLPALGVEAVIYQSCDGATFARDAKRLALSGFALAALHLFDFFPQSFHAESLALFCRR